MRLELECKVTKASWWTNTAITENGSNLSIFTSMKWEIEGMMNRRKGKKMVLKVMMIYYK